MSKNVLCLSLMTLHAVKNIFWSLKRKNDCSIHTWYFFTDVSSLKLWRYKDPVLGPLKIPVPGDYVTKCQVLDDASVLRVDVNANTVALASNGKSIDVGTKLIYTYDK